LEDFVGFFDDDFSEGGDVFEVLFHFGVLLIDEEFDFFGRDFADDINLAFGGLIGIVDFEDFSEEFLGGFVNFFWRYLESRSSGRVDGILTID
jgi:hypothetical protein